jgi:uncharacterized protein YhaN
MSHYHKCRYGTYGCINKHIEQAKQHAKDARAAGEPEPVLEDVLRELEHCQDEAERLREEEGKRHAQLAAIRHAWERWKEARSVRECDERFKAIETAIFGKKMQSVVDF